MPLRRFLPLLLIAALPGCSSDRSETAYGDVVLTDEELAEMDAFLDSARTAAAASVVSGRAAGGQPVPQATEEAERVWPAPDSLHYVTYRNEEYAYRFDYPDNLFQWDEPVGGDRGQSFETGDGSAVLLVFADDGGDGSLERAYEAEFERFDQEVSYHVLRPGWFVVSGHEGPYIFYQRTHRAADGGLRTVRLRHLARDRDYFDPITERLSHSFSG